MTNLRRSLLLVGIVAASLGVAFMLRNAAYDLVIVPLAYVWWVVSLVYLSIPQLIRWSLLVLCLGLALLWQMIPDSKPLSREGPRTSRNLAPVESLAVWVLKARRSNYYKWQLAHRLGRTARAARVLWGVHSEGGSPGESVRQYLDAGTDHSFVEFSGRRNGFRRRAVTPLDLDPAEAVDYLESQMEMSDGTQARSS